MTYVLKPCRTCKGERFTKDNRLCPTCGGDGCFMRPNIQPNAAQWDKLCSDIVKGKIRYPK